MGKANEFFGMDFGSPAPAPQPAEAKQEVSTSLLGRAEAFFGRVFSTDPTKPRATPSNPISVAPMGNRPPKPNAQEKDMAIAVKLSPAEQANDLAFEKTPGNLAELKREISRAKDPAILAILNQELAKLTKGK